jgi:hypothetical protein
MKRLLWWGWLLSWLAFGACHAGDAEEAKCEPGAEIFCRCRGGDAGTKQCRPDGNGFEQCYAESGPCEETAYGTSEEELEESDAKKLLEKCEASSECASGLCRMGYCTKPCGKWQECTDEAEGIYGDCVQIGSSDQYCVPYCASQADCEENYGEPSSCGYALAADAVAVVVCADWPEGPALPPDGLSCIDDWDCHLGYAEEQRVCEFGVCMGGCHETEDCPAGTSCQEGTPGLCQ